MKKLEIKVNLPADFADLYPELYYVGRGADPRGRNKEEIEAWEREDAERIKRLEARRLAADSAKIAKPEAAE